MILIARKVRAFLSPLHISNMVGVVTCWCIQIFSWLLLSHNTPILHNNCIMWGNSFSFFYLFFASDVGHSSTTALDTLYRHINLIAKAFCSIVISSQCDTQHTWMFLSPFLGDFESFLSNQSAFEELEYISHLILTTPVISFYAGLHCYALLCNSAPSSHS